MNKDFLKYRVYDTIKNRYLDGSEYEFLLHGDGNLLLGNWHGDSHFANPGFIVERCIGYSDKNGKLIYEGDIVETRIGAYNIVWSDTECGWALQHRTTHRMRAMNCFDFDEIKVFSNIHDATLA